MLETTRLVASWEAGEAALGRSGGGCGGEEEAEEDGGRQENHEGHDDDEGAGVGSGDGVGTAGEPVVAGPSAAARACRSHVSRVW